MDKETFQKIEEGIKELSIKELLEERKVLGKFITVMERQYKLNNNSIRKIEYIKKNKKDGSAAIVLPITEDNEILLIIQPRELTKRGVCVELPAGYIEDNETPRDAAERELLEETGYQSSELIELDEYYQDQACMEGINHTFLALGCKKVSKQSLDEAEQIKYFTCREEEIETLIKENYIVDVNTKYTLLKAKDYMRRG